MSFDSMRLKPEAASSYLRTDWSTEEEAFRVSIPEFRKSIEICNSVLENPPYDYEPEKKSAPETVASKEVPKASEDSPKKLQDGRTDAVECIPVQRSHSDPDMQPARPTQQEYVLNTSNVDPFDDNPSNQPKNKQSDDIFDFVEKPTTTPSVIAEQKPAPQAKAETKDVDPFDDFVVPQNSSPAPAATPISPPPIQAEAPKPAAFCGTPAPAAEPAQPAKLESVPPSAAVAEHPRKQSSLKPHGETKSGAEAMEGFDADRFEHVKATVAEMLEGCPDIDLDRLLNALSEYSVSLDLDYLRENPHVLTDKLLEIQAKRDTLHAQILRLSPLVVSMRHASEYFNSVGVTCSTASSREKRLAQVNFIISDFLIRLSKVDRTNTSVEHTFKHLADQYELCSRLITGYQIKTKIGEISRGEMPFDPPYKIVPAAGKMEVIEPSEAAKPTLAAKATGTAPRDEVGDQMLHRELSQPISTVKKFENLESFNSGLKPSKKAAVQSFVGGTKESEW